MHTVVHRWLGIPARFQTDFLFLSERNADVRLLRESAPWPPIFGRRNRAGGRDRVATRQSGAPKGAITCKVSFMERKRA
jgi:hypothetical protein